MAIGTVTLYDSAIKQISDTTNRQWNDATAGNIMWCLCSTAYTPALTHTTTTDLGASVITTGDGAPIATTTLALDSATLAGTTYFSSANPVFTIAANLTVKYLVCVQPVTANTFSATTSKLLFYVDLNATTTASTITGIPPTLTEFMPAYGWFATNSR